MGFGPPEPQAGAPCWAKSPVNIQHTGFRARDRCGHHILHALVPGWPVRFLMTWTMMPVGLSGDRPADDRFPLHSL
jgi:hypothetical protein